MLALGLTSILVFCLAGHLVVQRTDAKCQANEHQTPNLKQA